MWDDSTKEVAAIFRSLTLWCAIDPKRVTILAVRATHKVKWKQQVTNWIYRAKPREVERQRLKMVKTNALLKAQRRSRYEAAKPTANCKQCGAVIILPFKGGSQRAYCNRSCKNRYFKKGRKR